MSQAARIRLAETLVEQGLEAYGLGQEARAAALWQQALESNPEDERAREYLEIAADAGEARAANATPAPRDLRTPVAALDRYGVLDAVRRRDFERALELLYEARAKEPEDESVSLSIHHVKKKLSARYRRRIGDLDAIAAPTGRQKGSLAPEWATVLKLVDGITTFGDVLRASPLGRFETKRVLSQLLDAEFVGVVERPRTRSRPQMPAVRPVRKPPSSQPQTRPEEMRARVEEPPPVAAEAPATESDCCETRSYQIALRSATDAYLEQDYEAAERCYHRCLELRPDDARAKHNLEMLARRRRES
jgi:tetratricopeptide (TPR) repeat protein